MKLPGAGVVLSHGRRWSSTLLELAGFAVLVAAAWLWVPLVGVVALGLVLVLVGFAVDGSKPPQP